jgi:hypothetical protein
VIYRFIEILIKIPMIFFTKLKKKNPKLHMKPRKLSIIQNNLVQKEQSKSQYTTPGFKIYYKGIVIKRAWYLKRE